MNKLIITFFVVFICFSCHRKELKKVDENGQLIVYNQEVYTEMWIKNKNLEVTIVDTFCINQKQKAINDIEKGNLIYFRPNYLEFDEMSTLLRKYGITTKDFHYSCIRLGGFEPYCYQDEMYNEIIRKFGENFLDSLTEIAKRNFVIKNPNVEYFENGIDLRKKYLNQNGH